MILPDAIPQVELVEAVADTDHLLMCYTPITARGGAAPKLRGIVRGGVGIDAIDIRAA